MRQNNVCTLVKVLWIDPRSNWNLEMLVSVEGGKPENLVKTNLEVWVRTNSKLNPHVLSIPGFEPGPQWWKGSALATVPSLLPKLELNTGTDDPPGSFNPLIHKHVKINGKVERCFGVVMTEVQSGDVQSDSIWAKLFAWHSIIIMWIFSKLFNFDSVLITLDLKTSFSFTIIWFLHVCALPKLPYLTFDRTLKASSPAAESAFNPMSAMSSSLWHKAGRGCFSPSPTLVPIQSAPAESSSLQKESSYSSLQGHAGGINRTLSSHSKNRYTSYKNVYDYSEGTTFLHCKGTLDSLYSGMRMNGIDWRYHFLWHLNCNMWYSSQPLRKHKVQNMFLGFDVIEANQMCPKFGF